MLLLKKTLLLSGLFLLFSSYTSNAQFLKKLKEKVNSELNTTKSPSNSSLEKNKSSGSPVNKSGAGLTNTAPPDVNQEIADAEKSQKEGNYSDARYSIQQALMGIEIQIGKQILASLPASVSGLQKDTTLNRVMSLQWGWNNLTIQSVYKKGDQQMTVTIGNNSVYSGFVNLYFNSAYSQTVNNGKIKMSSKLN